MKGNIFFSCFSNIKKREAKRSACTCTHALTQKFNIERVVIAIITTEAVTRDAAQYTLQPGHILNNKMTKNIHTKLYKNIGCL